MIVMKDGLLCVAGSLYGRVISGIKANKWHDY
jgi:hypothetical protein